MLTVNTVVALIYGYSLQAIIIQVDVLKNLPVGEGLQDHVVFVGLVVTTNGDYIGLSKINQSIIEYHQNQTGLLTLPGAFEALLFTNSGIPDRPLPDYPDIELELTDVFPSQEIAKSPYVSNETYQKYYVPMLTSIGFMNAVALVHPKSRGTVKLNSSNYTMQPLIDPNMLSEQVDLDIIVNGTLKVMQLFNTDAMRAINATIWQGKYPPCENYTVWSPEYIQCFVRMAAFPGQHVCCTGAMGNHKNSVVDERLSQYCVALQGHETKSVTIEARTDEVLHSSLGDVFTTINKSDLSEPKMNKRGRTLVRDIKGLRIAVASVMPEITSGNINAAVLMIGDKAGSMIIEDAKKPVYI